tara:strand:- start:39892 stop:40914 length:1023 start_codon:yes stop_codon:yes gene_type:complete
MNIFIFLMKKILLSLIFLCLSNHVIADDKIIFGTNWVAQPEHGGFYQALAEKEYNKCGIKVEILQGGPNTNNRAKLISNKIDLYMGGNLIQLINSRSRGIPIKALAGFFQKDPQILMSHSKGKLDKWDKLILADPIFISDLGLITFYEWLIKEHNFLAEKRRPYIYNSAPFLSNINSVQQGYLTSEPYSIFQETGQEPNIFLLSDYGFNTYSSTIEAMENTINDRPEEIECFINASIKGWIKYLYDDPTKGNQIIKTENPEITDDKIAYSIAKMKEFGIVDSGDTIANGIGYMNNDRIRSFYNKMLQSEIVEGVANIDNIFDDQFIGKGVGLELKRQLLN